MSGAHRSTRCAASRHERAASAPGRWKPAVRLAPLAACLLVLPASPARAACGWVNSIQAWSGGLGWSWGHQAQWVQLPDSSIQASVQDGGSCTFDLTGFFGSFSGDVEGQLGFDDHLREEDLEQNVSFERTVLTGPIVGPYPGDKSRMLLLLDSTACTYTWMMTPWGNGTYTTESFSDPTTGIPSNIVAGTHPIPELPGPLSFAGSIAATTNPQVGVVEPQFTTDARAAHASVGRAPFQDASVSWSFEPGEATAPFNDTCAGATFLSGNALQDTSFATVDASEPVSGCGGGDRSVWFFFFSSVDGTAQISTAGSGYSTVVSVSPMTPSCGAPASESACGTGGATVPVQANGAYRVQVRRAGGGGTGALQLAVQVPEPSGALTTALASLAGLAWARRPRSPRRGPGMRRVARLAVVVPVALSSAPASALPTNPIDPELPLDQHAWALCIGASDPSTGSVQSSCFGANPVENPVTLSGVVGTGTGSADLRTGSLRSRSTAQAFWLDDDQIRAGGFAWVQLYDVITVEGGFTGTVELRMAIAGGFFTSEANPNVMGSEMRARLFGLDDAGLPVADARVQVFQYNSGEVGLSSQSTDGDAEITTNAGGPQNLFDPANVQVVLSVFVPITPESPSFGFRADLQTGAALGYTASVNQVKEAATEFGNTAQLALIVPQGVAWHSASGAFLAPEPAAAGQAQGLLVAGAALAALQRRRSGRRPRYAFASRAASSTRDPTPSFP